ncbi:DUF2607 family protein [Aliivibrio kagoshimensis]|uniref:DUF2607 family protein n=1 Tax=Aliivibrio kagoshimensis TaxID=2910230 RepID=UPI003D110F0B
MLRREQPNRWPAWGLVVLILLLSHTVISHQYDLDTSNHTEHNCSLFHAATHALTQHIDHFELPSYQSILTSAPRFHTIVIESISSNARSPPNRF